MWWPLTVECQYLICVVWFIVVTCPVLWNTNTDSFQLTWGLHSWKTSFNVKLWWLNNYLTNQPTQWSRVILEKWTGPRLEISCILWNPKVHYCIHSCLPPVPILSQISPVPYTSDHFLKSHFNIILPFMPAFSLRSPYQNPVYSSPISHMCHISFFWIWPHNNG
jgi:hypothetical protein